MATSTSSTVRRSSSPPDRGPPTCICVSARSGQVVGSRGDQDRWWLAREHPGVTVERLEDTDTAVIRFRQCPIPEERLSRHLRICSEDKGFAGVMETFDNTRPVVAAMAVDYGPRRHSRNCARPHRGRRGNLVLEPSHAQSAPAAEFLRMESDWESAYLLMVRSAWQADNENSELEGSVDGGGQGGRVASDITLKSHRSAVPSAIPSRRCWRSGLATARSSTSSRAHSRFSSWWWLDASWCGRLPN